MSDEGIVRCHQCHAEDYKENMVQGTCCVSYEDGVIDDILVWLCSQACEEEHNEHCATRL
jgi:hypothetical protein